MTRETKIWLILAFMLLPLGFVLTETPTVRESFPQVKGLQYSTKVSAQVGKNYLTVSGYTSPLAKVILSCSIGNLFEETLADQKGVFRFNRVLLPYVVGELSILTQDTDGLPSPPVYLPEPLPNMDLIIENLLLPPTLAFSSNNNEAQYATGKTFPNSPVLVYLYSEPKTTLWQYLKETVIKSVFAKTGPRLTVTSDENGEFEFSLPSVEPAEQKLFVASLADQIKIMTQEAKQKQLAEAMAAEPEEEQNYSPKSFTLTFETYSWQEKIMAFLILGIVKIIIWLKSKPTNFLWLELPLLLILTIEILLRGYVEKTISEENSLKP